MICCCWCLWNSSAMSSKISQTCCANNCWKQKRISLSKKLKFAESCHAKCYMHNSNDCLELTIVVKVTRLSNSREFSICLLFNHSGHSQFFRIIRLNSATKNLWKVFQHSLGRIEICLFCRVESCRRLPRQFQILVFSDALKFHNKYWFWHNTTPPTTSKHLLSPESHHKTRLQSSKYADVINILICGFPSSWNSIYLPNFLPPSPLPLH